MTHQSQAETPHNYPDVFYRELAVFRPSPVLQRMNGLLSAIPVDLRKLGKAVQEAAWLAAEAVKLSNSSLFGLPRPVSSLEQAVVATDADIVRTLLLTCWLTRVSGSEVSTIENQVFWGHSLQVAQISRKIGEWMDLPHPEHAFLAGLLHDIGVLPFLTLFSRDRTAGQQSIFKDLNESLKLQRCSFGTDHCELGRRLGTILDFPLRVGEVISKHHQAGLAMPGFPLLSIVGAAEALLQARYLCAKRGLPTGAMGAYMKDSLVRWLPGLIPSVSHHLIVALESDFFANTDQPTLANGNVRRDSASGGKVQSPVRCVFQDSTANQ